MLRIDCPWCGERDHSEFSYGGDATVGRPSADCEDAQVWYEYVYERDNPRGRHRELWQHTLGCRQWLIVERDTVTHRVFEVQLAAEAGE